MKHLRFACVVLALSAASDAAAQINERDRLARCENNRARMLEIRARWPRNEEGWSDDRIAGARAALVNLERMNRESAFTREMVPIARQFDVMCFPEGPPCGDVLIAELQRKIVAADDAAPRREALLREFNGHRSNYLALNCVEGATASASSSDLGFAMMTGTFDSSFGLLTLSTGGGSYDYYGGQVRVSGISGNVMEGSWTQTRAGRQCPDGRYRGRFRFEFSSTGFIGAFGYCDEEPSAGVWNGTRR